MKVIVKHISSGVNKRHHELLNNFIEFLQKKIPVKHDITVLFLGDRIGGMSTGSRTKEHLLKVLTKNRLNRDICRTLAHEWVHEYQHGVLGKKRGPDIGGENENEANAKAGALVKMFEKEFPDMEESMYE